MFIKRRLVSIPSLDLHQTIMTQASYVKLTLPVLLNLRICFRRIVYIERWLRLHSTQASELFIYYLLYLILHFGLYAVF